jgi:hypothetical protein
MMVDEMKRILLALLLLPLSTYAQSDFAKSLKFMEGTLEITPTEMTSGGKLVGCQLEYGAAFFDNATIQGEPYVIKGSISLIGSNNNTNIAVGLKLGTNRAVSKGDGKVDFIPERPYLAYLKAPSGVANIGGYRDKYEADNLPGGMFYVYQLDVKVLEIIEQMMDKKSVSIVFNRKEGGLDITVPLDLTVASVNDRGQRTRSDKPMTAFSSCFNTFTGLVTDNIKKQQPK